MVVVATGCIDDHHVRLLGQRRQSLLDRHAIGRIEGLVSRHRQRDAVTARIFGAIVEIAAEGALARIEIDRRHPPPHRRQRHGDMDRAGRLARSTLFVGEDDAMRGHSTPSIALAAAYVGADQRAQLKLAPILPLTAWKPPFARNDDHGTAAAHRSDLVDIATDGDGAAAFELGMAYSSGACGLGVDLVEAHRWLNVAALSGHHAAASWRQEIAAEMSARQVVEAQKLARATLAMRLPRAA